MRASPKSTIVVYTQKGASYVCPDKEIKKPNSSYVYVPTRGFSGSLTVFNKSNRCVGWIDTRSLGFPNAKAWMAAHPEWKELDY